MHFLIVKTFSMDLSSFVKSNLLSLTSKVVMCLNFLENQGQPSLKDL